MSELSVVVIVTLLLSILARVSTGLWALVWLLASIFCGIIGLLMLRDERKTRR